MRLPSASDTVAAVCIARGTSEKEGINILINKRSIACQSRGWVLLPVLSASALMVATSALADPKDGRSSLVAAAAQCTTIAQAAERLACYDKAVNALLSAEQKREVVVIDRAQVRQTRKALFGLNLPNFGLFGDATDRNSPDAVTQIETTLTKAEMNGGAWLFILADGARWRQTDDNILGGRPRVGDKVVIRRGALGSFKLSLAGQPAIKVRREN